MPEADVRATILRMAKDWAEIYMAREENGPLWVKSLFAGIDHRLRERLGILEVNKRRAPGWAICAAFSEGRLIGEELTTALDEDAIRAFYKSWAEVSQAEDLVHSAGAKQRDRSSPTGGHISTELLRETP